MDIDLTQHIPAIVSLSVAIIISIIILIRERRKFVNKALYDHGVRLKLFKAMMQAQNTFIPNKILREHLSDEELKYLNIHLEENNEKTK